MTSEEKQKALDALKISAPVMAVTQEEFNDYIQTLNKIMDWLEQKPCEDAISRQAVLDALYELCNTGETLIENPWRDNPHIDALVDAIEELPPVNPQEPKTDSWSIKDVADTFKKHGLIRDQEPSGDLISRQAVIDIIHRFFTEEVDKIPTKETEDGEVYVIRKCQPLFEMNKAICKRIKALPSVPTVQVIPIEKIKTLINDIEIMRTSPALIDNDDVQRFAENVLYALNLKMCEEEQELKTGHWIMPVQDDGMSDPIYYQVRCSKCGFDLDPQTWHQELHQYDADKYCPKCGAKMESEG